MQALSPFEDETATQRAFRESMLEAAKAQARAVLTALGEGPQTVLGDFDDLDHEFEDDELQRNGPYCTPISGHSVYFFDDELLS